MNPRVVVAGSLATHIWGQLRSAGLAATLTRKQTGGTFDPDTNTQVPGSGSISILGVVRQLRSRSLEALLASLSGSGTVDRTEQFEFVVPPLDANGEEFTFTPGKGDMLVIGVEAYTITNVGKVMLGELLAAWVFTCAPS